ncbi:filamentous hemagglutinin N-terminal domain-containing protein [Oscillatoria sp. FACHB-1407]|uniref:two-partner secretion domain-containing protein n=1 Tax=Oscillatoria sp. FACHB-1407 TaxID=2692847 RepID=UPI0016872789|nr:filamentous hemagglutinin N-terminal domain-containing protein [Oscillatoria sp. FACHB-1407]MBD2463031.1 filamentous hemagglutinin N-terminal domain-containing protein [Oscillatoria sp. FACHB-1407]
MNHSLAIAVIGSVVFISTGMADTPAIAQITPDSTLGTEASSTASGRVGFLPATLVNGGSIRGAYLFHSFSEFHVRANQRVYFSNPSQVSHILTRVTGDNPSNILGTLGVNGSANLFLLNPNGIVFGSDAMLDIRGSFTASTGDRFTFPDGSEFSATNPQAPPLLTINVPVGLQFGERIPGDIVNEGILEVGTGQSLTLWGGNITNIGTISITEGQIQLNATQAIVLDGFSSVIQNIGGNIDLRSSGNILIANQASISSSPSTLFGGTNAGTVSLRADDNISILNGGSLFSAVPLNVTGNAGAILIQAGNTVTAQFARISSSARGAGNGGDINIRGRSLSITDNSRIFATTSSTGAAGSIRLRALEAIDVSNSVISSGTNVGSTGNGGSLEIQADRFTAQDETIFSTATDDSGRAGDLTIAVHQLNLSNAEITTKTLGSGDAGNLIINTTGDIILGESSSITTTSQIGSGDAGNLTINARQLTVTEGGQIATATSSSGNAGDLTINVRQLTVTEGGQIVTGTVSSGNAGDLTIVANDRVSLFGVAENGTQSGLFTQSSEAARGTAGTLRLTTGELEVSDRAGISVSGIGGNPGNLFISADRITLNRGILEAVAVSGENANIQLQVADTLFMQRGSRISAEARNDGSGGNLAINARFVIALPDQNSDIIANAFNGPGGQITITADSILGLAERQAIPGNITNDIDASSQFGAPGTVTINSPDDPNRGLVELPAELADASGLIAQNCTAGGVANRELGEFYVTGRGGLPPNPIELLGSETILSQLANLGNSTGVEHEDTSANISQLNSPNRTIDAPIEAERWITNSSGQVVLIARPHHAASLNAVICPS